MPNELISDSPAFFFLPITGVASLLAAASMAGELTRWRLACRVAQCNNRVSCNLCFRSSGILRSVNGEPTIWDSLKIPSVRDSSLKNNYS